MPIVHVLGKVFPPALIFSIDNLPPVDWNEPETGQTMHITTRITDSAVDVEFDLNFYDESKERQLTDIMVRAWDLASMAVNIFAYSHGNGMAVLLDTFVRPDGTTSALYSKHEYLAEKCTAFDLTSPEDSGKFYNLVASDIGLFIAFNDLVSAITFPHLASINAARAVEGIRHLIAPGIERNQGWEIMRNNLNLDDTYVRFVTKMSAAPRHGDRTAMPSASLVETLKRAWVIMDRYLFFRRRGNQALPLTDFSLLRG